MLIFNLIKDFYEDIDAIFTNFKLKDKKVGQLHINSAIVVELFDNTISLDQTVQKFINFFKAKIRAKKKIGSISKEESTRFDNIIVVQKVIKSKDDC